MPRYDATIDEVFASYDPTTLLRGREYADDGRVAVTSRDVATVRAVVRGNGAQPYDVAIGEDRETCTCPAFDREGRCKHIAALAHVLRRGRPQPVGTALPAIFRSVYSASSVLSRLGLYSGVAPFRPGEAEPDRWLSLADWFWRAKNRRNLTDHTAEIESVLERLRTWLPPRPSALPASGFEILYAQLAELYEESAEEADIRHALPGPLDERHPGWTFTYDAKRRTFEARERSAPLLARPLRLAVSVALAPGQPLRFEGQAFASYSGADAWEVFALRAMLEALHARTDDAVRALERDLGRPLWEHVLDDLSSKTPRAEEPREWRFAIAPTYHDYAFTVTAYSRATSGRATKWKKQPFEALFADEAATSDDLEREIARVAMCSVEVRNESMLRLATPQGHELARLLATHRNVVFAPSKGQIDVPLPARFLVGTLTLALENAADATGTLAPRLLVHGEELPFPPAMLGGTGMFRGGAQVMREDEPGGPGLLIVSAQVPSSLRAWLDALAKMGSALAFPPEAVPKLAAQPVIASGAVTLPREALGQELAPEPRAALRVEWRPDGAFLEPLIAVHPKAPLVAAGAGARLFTFEIDGKRVFVERNLESEDAIIESALEGIDAPIDWTAGPMGGGVVTGVADMIALAAWLDANPLEMPIEYKKGGRRPEVTAFGDAGARIQVSKRGSWLRLDGELDVQGVKLTFGDVLEAARHARRYVKAAEGVFLELSVETIEKLQPLAIAAALAPANDNAGPGAIVHDAFGTLLAQAKPLFSEVKEKGVELDEYLKRFTARSRATKVPPLEKGTLRPYQKEGAEWMLQLATWAPGCVLADDMGLGKTVQTASVLKARAKLGPALIIAPASVSSNWVSELARFMPSLDVRWFNAERDSLTGDVVVVSYGLLQRCKDEFASVDWATVVVDEAQYVKNVGAARTDAVRSLKRKFTIALTGTPLENHLGELFSIIDLVFPGLLGDEAGFREHFRRPIESKRDPERLSSLSRLIAPFLLRRTRAEVLRELPAREEITERLELSAPEQKRYLALRKACEEQFARGRRKRGETPAQFRIALLAALTRLRQLACDPRLVDKTYEGPLTKLARAVELTTELASEGNRALVFSQFTSFLEKVRDALKEAGLRVAYLAGDTPTAKRQALVEAFQNGAYDVFCVSLLAGGTGLNLTRASYVVHLDPWWNPASEEQATSRAHRMGQTEPVTVYRLVARGTIEEAVLEMHEAKKKLATAVLEGKGTATAISEHELLELLRFGA
jgi:superfamily II DNA or RNA helicase